MNELREQLLKKKNDVLWSAFCYAGVCDQLKQVGISLKDKPNYLPSSFFKSFFEGGFVDSAGNPIKIEIYRTNNYRLNNIYINIQESEQFDINAFKAIFMGSVVVIAGTTLYFIAAE